jgi:hypothetical protein
MATQTTGYNGRGGAGIGVQSEAQAREAYSGSSFAEVWDQVKSDPYPLPANRVTLASFFAGMRYQLLRSGRRTIADQRDILPQFNKLIRPNGIALAGTWTITEESPYTGFFARGAKGLIIARASVAFGRTERGSYRSFGMAGKLFPTVDRDKRTATANFFVIDDNGGTLTPSYLDAELLTHAKLSINRGSLAHLPLLIAITVAQRIADTHSEVRQLYPIARAGGVDAEDARAPELMMIRADTAARAGAPDFRDELRVALYDGKVLPFGIFVRDDARHAWQRLGRIEFTDDVVSNSCDHRLHFSHPKWIRRA